MFPYHPARNVLIDLARTHLPNQLRPHADVIVNLHLREDTLPMPSMTGEQHQAILNMIIAGNNVEAVVPFLELEDTANRIGMLRVMARTHLNRSGINDISRGYSEKTLSPRILHFIDALPLDHHLNQEEVLMRWSNFAHDHHADANAALSYDNSALSFFNSLVDANQQGELVDLMNPEDQYTASRLAEEFNINRNWSRIFLGILSGWAYLWNNDWQAFNNAMGCENAETVQHLMQECRAQIVEYGPALSGSFFADLGAPSFVKDDVHVRDSMLALDQTLTTPLLRVNAVIESALEQNVAPRLLDKVMFTACSGRFPLLNVRFDNPRQAKESFIEFLGGWA